MIHRRTVALDFDGVLHKHLSKWTVAWEIHDGPVKGAFEFLERVLLEFNVVIFSARAADPRGRGAVFEWLVRNWVASGRDPEGIALVRVSAEKPNAFIYIDDRGWRFEGTFPTMDELRSFESWTKKRRFVVTEDGYRDYGDLSAVEPPYRVAMSCEKCKTRWLGCWDNFQCPECGEGELPKSASVP